MRKCSETSPGRSTRGPACRGNGTPAQHKDVGERECAVRAAEKDEGRHGLGGQKTGLITHHWVVALDDAELGVWFLRGHESRMGSGLARVQSRTGADWAFLLNYLRTIELFEEKKSTFRLPIRHCG